jgi:hypothetical protein
MKKHFFILIFIGIGGFAFSQNDCLNFKGFYAFKLNNENSAVLRFYEDGIVIASTSTNDYKHVATWFTKENKDMVLNGKYKLKKCRTNFTVKGYTGEQKYVISAGSGSLEAEITDVKSKKSTKRTYTFISS